MSPSSSPQKVRQAAHAGSWYTNNGAKLDQQLSSWLSEVKGSELPPSTQVASTAHVTAEPVQLPVPTAKAIIGPHAGYSYSGPPAAYAYACIPKTSASIKRVFLLGPSHHFYLDGCALSRCSAYETPIGNLPVDRKTTEELHASGSFDWMSQQTDEDEHSMEMHAPYIRKVFEDRQDIEIVPILVGAISAASEARYGEILAPYLADPANFFVVSSDFCHWGSRFSYTFYRENPRGSVSHLSSRTQPSAATPIHQAIRELDDEGMQAIAFPLSTSDASSGGKTAQQSQVEFTEYLRRTKNTVCGRHPIGVLLGALAYLEKSGAIKDAECRFTRYEQSSQCLSARDSSVSYASAFVAFSPTS